MSADGDGLMLEEEPKQQHKFIQAVLNEIESHEFHFDILLASTAFLFWLRFLFMLQLTSTFGPLIKTIVAMTLDMA